MADWLLSFLILAPVIGMVVVLILPTTQPHAIKMTTAGVVVLQLIAAMYLAFTFSLLPEGENQYTLESFAFVEQVNWFTISLFDLGTVKASYLLGVDGLSVGLVVMSTIILCIALLASWGVSNKVKGYFALFLLLNASIIGCFVALDFLLFYLFFEFMLLPMYFLIGLWGGKRRDYASIKFFLYTLVGSVLILIVMIGLYLSVMDPVSTAVEMGWVANSTEVTQDMVIKIQQQLQAGTIPADRIVRSFNMINMADAANIIPGTIFDVSEVSQLLNMPGRWWGFLLIFIGFGIKIPMVPVHTWLPDAHVEASTPISVILAALLLKVGGYGLMRTGYLIFPDTAVEFTWLVAFLGVLSIIYGAMNALGTADLKRLIAYSSVSHMGFVLLGLASMTVEGVTGAVFQMISHGFISAGLFLIAGVLYDRTHDRTISNYSGIATQMPKYTVIVVAFFFASLGLPGFSGFIAEILVFLGAFAAKGLSAIPTWMVIIAVASLVLTAAYYLWTIQRMFFGKYHIKVEGELSDLNLRELVSFIPLFALVLILGIFPQTLLGFISHSVQLFVEICSIN